jgi:hypothetical protein
MSRQFVVGKLKGEERKAIIQGVQKQMQEAALGAIKPRLSTFSISTLSKGYATHLSRPLRSDYTTCFAIRHR